MGYIRVRSMIFKTRTQEQNNNQLSEQWYEVREMHWKWWIIQKLYQRRKWLKIANGYPEAVRRRRKDNEMVKRKRTNNGITQQPKEQANGTLHNASVELWWPTMVSSFSFICDTDRVTIATNNKIMNETNDWIVITTSITYSWSFVTQIFRNG
jgi:hypothetical protein